MKPVFIARRKGETMKKEEYLELLKKEKKKRKYNNKKVEVDGIKFDSIGESERYKELKILFRAGIIKELSLQPKFELIPKQKDERAVTYTADFQYKENGEWVVEDFKGMKTRDYIIRRKLFKYLNPEIIFRETGR